MKRRAVSWLIMLTLSSGIHCLPAAEEGNNSVALEALGRLQGVDLEANPAVKAAVLKFLEKTRGTPDFVQIVRQFKLTAQEPGLLEVAIKNPASEAGVEALRIILATGSSATIQDALRSPDVPRASKTAEALGNTREKAAVPLLQQVLADPQRDIAVRKQATKALAQTHDGAGELLRLAEAEHLADDLKFTAGSELNAALWPDIKTRAAKILPPPEGRNAQPLPPVAELIKMKGDAANGETIFFRDTSLCANCHKIRDRGAEVGPNLSEIGSKLGKDALVEAILDPSAGISMGFETFHIELKNGDDLFGLIASETPEELSVKDSRGVLTRYRKSDVTRREKLTTSLMPSGLQASMSRQEFIDLLEFLFAQKKTN